MFRFIFSRLLLLIPVTIGILLITFAIVRLIPGDPCVVMLGERATQAKCDEFKARYGLDQPIPIQFGRYVANLSRGDFGASIRTGQNVTDVIAQRLPMTIELAFFAMIFSSVVGILLGVISAVRRNSAVDLGTMVIANVGVSMPVFWLGMMLAYIFALLLRDTPFFIPPAGRLSSNFSLTPLQQVWHLQDLSPTSKFLVTFISNSVILHSILVGDIAMLRDGLWHLILPSVAVGTIPLAIIARMTRSSLLEVLGQDYVRTARAKGIRERLVLFRHSFRNALIPIVTVIGLQTGSLLSGAVLTETVFSLPGIGSVLVQSILARDYPVVQGFTVVIAIIFVLVNLLVDLSYVILDPRIRLQ